MLKIVVTIVGLTIVPIVITVVTTTSGGVITVSASSHTAPAPLLAAGLPAFIALGGAGAVGALARRSFKSSRQTRATDDRTVA